MKKKTFINKQRVPWLNSDIKQAISARRKAERKWLNTRTFALSRLHVITLHISLNSERRDYFSNLIAENSSNQRKLFRTTNSLLFEPTDVSFPDHIPPDDLANNFGNYLVQKIELINDSLDALRSSEPLDGASDASADNVGACANCVDPDPRECVEFPNFKTLTQDQVSLLLERQP